MQVKADSRNRRILGIAIPCFAFVIMGFCWAFASPPGSSADDDFHLASIWCAWGDSDTCVTSPIPSVATVPDKVTHAACYAALPGQSAACVRELKDELVQTLRVNVNSGYPPVYYKVMRVFVGPIVTKSVMAMRLFNVALAAAMLAFALTLARPAVRRAVALSWMACLVPVGAFFIASSNPSSWAIVGCSLLWVFLLTLIAEPSFRTRRAIAATIGALICVFMAMSARSDSAYILIVSMLAVGIVGWPHIRRRPHLMWVGLLAIPIALIAVAFRFGHYLQQNLSFPPGNEEWDQPNPLFKLLLELPNFIIGILGGQNPFWSQRASSVDSQMPGFSWPGFSYGVGWTDVSNPGISGMLILVSVAAVVFVGFRSYNWRKIGAVALLTGALTAQIIAVRAMADFKAESFLQPRYFYALVLIIVGFIAVVYPVRKALINKGQSTLLVVGLTIAYSTALLATMGRYVYGQDHSWTGISGAFGWWWTIGPSPITYATIGTIASVVWLIGMVRIGRDPLSYGLSEARNTSLPEAKEPALTG